MTPADWGLLVPAVVALVTAATAWLRANAAHRKATKVDQLVRRRPPGA